MTVAQTIRSKLEARFSPLSLEIFDESGRHAGHAGSRPEGETHFRIVVTAAAFAGLSRLARQRLVYETLGEELKTRIHALSLEARAPAEDPAVRSGED